MRLEGHCPSRAEPVNRAAGESAGRPAVPGEPIRARDPIRPTPPVPRAPAAPLPRPRPTRRTLAAALAAAGAAAAGTAPGCVSGDLLGGTTRAAVESGTRVANAARGAADGVRRLAAAGPVDGVRAGVARLAPPESVIELAEGISGTFADPDRRDYLGTPGPATTLTSSTGLAEPDYHPPPPPEAVSEAPLRVGPFGAVRDGLGRELWDLSLDEAIKLTLERTRVLRDGPQFGASTNPLLAAPLAVVSVFDPAIQETGVGFNRGVEAALADFDAQFTASFLNNRDERIQNNPFIVGRNAGSTLVTEDGQFRTALTKTFATGGTATFSQDVNRRFSNVNQQLFPSVFETTAEAQFRQPLLAGAGTRFNRIAGPNARNNRFLGNLDQGVLIARINTDQSIADFEREVRDLLREVERAYWDLGAAYHAYDAEATAKAALLDLYNNVRVRSEEQLTGGGAGEVALALDQYREAEFRTRDARANLLRSELSLRRLMNLPVSDGRVIRPSEEPVTAEFDPDWRASLSGALVNRVELRRQRWEVKRLGLQLEAARNAARPQLDVVSGYRVNGFGDELLGDGGRSGLDSAARNVADGDQTGWTLGFEFALPVGLRAAKTQIRNLELRIAKAKATLDTQEHEISHELAVAFQDVARQYGQATTALARRQAAVDRVAAFDALRDTAQGDLDLLLRSEVSVAQSETQYWQAVYAYNQAIADVFHRQGTLLERDGVFLAEGDWRPEAYRDATREAWARANAIPAPLLDADPEPFARPERPPVPLPVAAPAAGAGGTVAAPPPPAPFPPAATGGEEDAPIAAPPPFPLPDESATPPDAPAGADEREGDAAPPDLAPPPEFDGSPGLREARAAAGTASL